MSRLLRGCSVLTGLMVCITCGAAEPPDLNSLLQTFVEEFVAIQPGQGKFPDHLLIPAVNAETPAKSIPIKDAFAIGKYEVPQNLYEAVMGVNPSRWKGPRNSVELMNWQEANKFCAVITGLLRERKLIGAEDVIRLPTELEWEYCCRAGTTTAYSFGEELRRANDPAGKNSILDEYAWYTGNAAGNDPPVGALKPNPWGLYDMHGYLWEFTADAWSDRLQTEQREAPEVPEAIVLKGGSWKDRAEQLTIQARKMWKSTAGDDAIGFRCVLAKASRLP